MKKYAALSLALILSLSLAACGGGEAPKSQSQSGPSSGASSDPSSPSQAPTPESTPSSAAHKPVGEFYNSDGECLTVTEDTLSFAHDGKDYSVDYPAAPPETVDAATQKLTFTADGQQVELYYRPTDFTLEQTKTLQLVVDGRASEKSTYLSRTKGSTPAMAGSYKGDSGSELTIAADGAFTFTAPGVDPIAGTIPQGHKSGDPIPVGDQTLTLYYGSDFDGMSVDLRTAAGEPVVAFDMVRS